MRIFGWDIDPITMLIVAVVWVVGANLWVWRARRARGQRMAAVGQRLGLEYRAQADVIKNEIFSRAQLMAGGFNAPLDVASAATFALKDRHFTQAVMGRLDDMRVLAFDVETPRFRSLHPDRRTVIAWNVSAAWPSFYVNPMAFGVDALSALQGLRDQEGVEVLVGESLANFAEDHLGISMESCEGWLLMAYHHRVMDADEAEKVLADSRAMLARCGVAARA